MEVAFLVFSDVSNYQQGGFISKEGKKTSKDLDVSLCS